MPSPGGGHLRPAGGHREGQRRGEFGRRGGRPVGAGAGALHAAGALRRAGVERGALHRGERQRPLEQRRHHVLVFPAGALEVAGERAEGAEPAAQVVEHQEQDAAADRQLEEDVEIVAPGVPRPLGPQDEVVEMVDAPEQERAGQEPGAGAAHPVEVAEEDPPGGERGEGQEEHGRQRRPDEMIEPVDRDEGPDRREQRHQEVAVPPTRPPREHQRRPQQRQRRPPREHLVPVEPAGPRGGQEAEDGPHPEHVERPRRREPGEVRLPVAPVEVQAERGEGREDDRLEDRRRAFEPDRGHGELHGGKISRCRGGGSGAQVRGPVVRGI